MNSVDLSPASRVPIVALFIKLLLKSQISKTDVINYYQMLVGIWLQFFAKPKLLRMIHQATSRLFYSEIYTHVSQGFFYAVPCLCHVLLCGTVFRAHQFCKQPKISG